MNAIKEDLAKNQKFSDVKIIDKVLYFKINNTLINQFEADEIVCYFSLTEDGTLSVEYKDGESLIMSCILNDTKILNYNKLLEVLYNRPKFTWKCNRTEISEKYSWIYF